MRAMTTASAALPDDAPHLLVVDDDRRIRDLLSRFLFAEGYRVTTAETAADARAKLAGLRFDLLILDVMMPGKSGFDLARDLPPRRRHHHGHRRPGYHFAPRLRQIVRGNTRSLSIQLFVSLIVPLVVATLNSRPPAPTVPESLLELTLPCKEIVRLTDRERDMLRLLAATPGETVPRQTLAGNDGATGERAVDVQVNRLRRKIEHDPANPLLVQTVRGIGYRLVTTP